VRGFLPLWLQKSWGRWTSYGGGYWINGSGQRQPRRQGRWREL